VYWTLVQWPLSPYAEMLITHDNTMRSHHKIKTKNHDARMPKGHGSYDTDYLSGTILVIFEPSKLMPPIKPFWLKIKA
jgi:hypothetical protein